MPKQFKQIAIEFFSDDVQEEPVPVVEDAPPAEIIKNPPQKQDKPKQQRGRPRLKDGIEGPEPGVPEDEVLYQKQYYTIGEVSEMFRVNNSLLRHWEKEFDILKLRKNRKGDRYFRPDDVKSVELIYDLLRRRKYTIEGAKTYLKKAKQAREKNDLIQSLQKLRSFLLEIKANL